MDLIKMLRQYQAQKTSLVEKANALLGKEDATDDDVTAAEELQNQVEALNKKIATVEKQIELQKQMKPVQDEQGDDVTAVAGNAIAAQPKKKFASFAENIQAIYRAVDSKHHDVDERLLALEEEAKVNAAAAGGAAAVGSDGGYLIQADFSEEIMRNAFETGQILSRCRKATVSQNSDKLVLPYIDETSRANGSRGGGVQTYWANEADAATAKKPKIGKLEVPLHKVIGLAYMTKELMTDAPAMDTIYRQTFEDEIKFVVEDAILNGNGVGQPLGILNHDALVSVAKETGQSANTIVQENISKMWSRSRAVNRNNAVWLYNQEIEPQLDQLNVNIGTGGQLVYMPSGGLTDAPTPRLKGRPMIATEYSAALGTVGDLTLADLMEYLVAEKGQIRVDVSEHVNFTSDEICMRFVFRVGGQPLTRKVLTPYKGANTLSPYVALATRS